MARRKRRHHVAIHPFLNGAVEPPERRMALGLGRVCARAEADCSDHHQHKSLSACASAAAPLRRVDGWGVFQGERPVTPRCGCSGLSASPSRGHVLYGRVEQHAVAPWLCMRPMLGCCHKYLVGYSHKRRDSCFHAHHGRGETGAHLADNLLPCAANHHWLVSSP